MRKLIIISSETENPTVWTDGSKLQTILGHMYDPAYDQKVKVKGRPVPVSAYQADDYRILMQVGHWSKEEHQKLALQFLEKGKESAKLWDKLANEASMQTFGRPYQITDYKVSGIARDEYSPEFKELLRKAITRNGACRTLATLHLQCAKNFGRYQAKANDITAEILGKLSGMRYGNYKYTAEEWIEKTGADPRMLGTLIDIRPNGLCGWTKRAEEAYKETQRGIKQNWAALGIKTSSRSLSSNDFQSKLKSVHDPLGVLCPKCHEMQPEVPEDATFRSCGHCGYEATLFHVKGIKHGSKPMFLGTDGKWYASIRFKKLPEAKSGEWGSVEPMAFESMKRASNYINKMSPAQFNQFDEMVIVNSKTMANRVQNTMASTMNLVQWETAVIKHIGKMIGADYTDAQGIFEVYEMRNRGVISDNHNNNMSSQNMAKLILAKQKKSIATVASSVTIEKSQGEFRVPAKDGYEDGACYTEDKQDAIDTAKHIWGSDVQIKFRSVPEFVGGKYEKHRPTTASEDNYDAALEAFMAHIKLRRDKENATMKGHMAEYYQGPKLEQGGVWDRLVVTNGGSGSVYCFIKKENGDIYKAASYKAPAKNKARGNIYNVEDYVKKLNSVYGMQYSFS